MDKFTLKNALRKDIRSLLKNLPASARQEQSKSVVDQVLNHPQYKKSHGVAVFISLPDEIDTRDIIEHIFQTGRKCYIPRYSPNSQFMTMTVLKSLEDLSHLPKTKWNIPQPHEDEEREDCLQTGGIDLVLTPGLAFTSSGSRLGRSKGYYDKFFESYQSKFPLPYLLGLALQPSMIEDIPVTETDVKLDEIISPKFG